MVLSTKNYFSRLLSYSLGSLLVIKAQTSFVSHGGEWKGVSCLGSHDSVRWNRLLQSNRGRTTNNHIMHTITHTRLPSLIRPSINQSNKKETQRLHFINVPPLQMPHPNPYTNKKLWKKKPPPTKPAFFSWYTNNLPCNNNSKTNPKR